MLKIRGLLWLLWGFYTFCEPSVRPHFIASTKQARRTGDKVQSSSVKVSHFGEMVGEWREVPSFLRPI